MSRIEELTHNALEHGQRDKLLEKVNKIRENNPYMSLGDIYSVAYQEVMKTS
jgi:hypothetical protein